jgi:multidrug transporter EmrE-like cation transporter
MSSHKRAPAHLDAATRRRFLFLAAAAGMCGALSSVCGKLSFGHALDAVRAAPTSSSTSASGPNSLVAIITTLALTALEFVSTFIANVINAGAGAYHRAVSSTAASSPSSSDASPFVVQWQTVAEGLLRAISFGGNAVATGAMWRYFLKALSLGPTPVAQIINTGVNFAASAFFGILLFGEVVGPLFWVGAATVLLGLALIVKDEN